MIGMAMLALAASQGSATDFGYQKIVDGRLDAAEASLAAAPAMPEAMINLAQVYRRTGRFDEARAMYRRVLASDNVDLVLGDYRTAWSHDLARRGIATLPQLAAR